MLWECVNVGKRAEATPLPVCPMEPYFRKLLYGNERRETNDSLIPLDLHHESLI